MSRWKVLSTASSRLNSGGGGGKRDQKFTANPKNKAARPGCCPRSPEHAVTASGHEGAEQWPAGATGPCGERSLSQQQPWLQSANECVRPEPESVRIALPTYIPNACFHIQSSWEHSPSWSLTCSLAATQTEWPTKLKILTIWPFAERAGQPLV